MGQMMGLKFKAVSLLAEVGIHSGVLECDSWKRFESSDSHYMQAYNPFIYCIPVLGLLDNG